MSRCAGVVLTGGASRRMGTDKAFVVVDGRPMAIAVADALWEAGCQPVECQGGDLDGLASLGLSSFPDDHPDGGPADAIRTASARHEAPILIAACDLPGIDAPTVTAVLDAGSASDRLAVAVASGRRHLLAYVPPGVIVGDLVGRSVLDVFADAIEVPVDATALRNVNSPDDLRPDGSGR